MYVPQPALLLAPDDCCAARKPLLAAVPAYEPVGRRVRSLHHPCVPSTCGQVPAVALRAPYAAAVESGVAMSDRTVPGQKVSPRRSYRDQEHATAVRKEVVAELPEVVTLADRSARLATSTAAAAFRPARHGSREPAR